MCCNGFHSIAVLFVYLLFIPTFRFEILYYLIGLLYLLLDLEIVLLFPLVVRLFTLPPLAFLIVLAFMILLTLGFLYEWLRGALEIIMIYATFIRPLFDTGLLGCFWWWRLAWLDLYLMATVSCY